MTWVQNSNSIGPCPQWASNPSANQLSASGFTHNASGNMTGDGSYSYAWNGEGLLKLAGTTTYTYDGDDKRVEKSSGTYYWFRSSGSVLAETDTGGNTQNEYIYFSGGRTARGDSSSNVYYYFQDQIGTSRLIANSSGTVCYDADFAPFGYEMAYVTSCSQNYKFTGMERDVETGNDHAWFRNYEQNLGRWMSPDPLGGDITNPQSLNRYAYVMNSPTSLTDPLGLFYVLDCAGAPSWDWPCGGSGTVGGGGGGASTDPLDPCSYVGYTGAECQQPPGLWPNGQPIFSGSSASGFGFGGGGFGSGPLSGDFGPLDPMSLQEILWPDSWSQPGCEFGPCMPSEIESLAGGCPAVPASPPNASVDRNINWALTPGPSLAQDLEFLSLVQNYGPWDYKRQGIQYAPFGNFNYGAVGAALGAPLVVLQMGGGYVAQHRGGTHKSVWGEWYQPPYFGHDPEDVQSIRNGYLYFQNGCYKNGSV